MIEIADNGIEIQGLITYIIDGIDDTTANKLFLYHSRSINELKEKMKVYETYKSMYTTTKYERSNRRFERQDNDEYRKKINKRCGNCGELHDTTSCPKKADGPKCFKCNAFGHRSFDEKWPKNKSTTANNERPRTAIMVNRKRAEKLITINGNQVICHVDTRSDINTIQLKTFKQLNLPKFSNHRIQFDGVGSTNKTIGYITVNIIIDGIQFEDILYIKQNQNNIPQVIVGLSLINQTIMTVMPTGIKFQKLPAENNVENDIVPTQSEFYLDEIKNEAKQMNEVKQSIANDFSQLPFIAMIHVTNDFVELNHIKNEQFRNETKMMIETYTPKMTKKCPVELKIILKDDEPVYQRARRKTFG